MHISVPSSHVLNPIIHARGEALMPTNRPTPRLIRFCVRAEGVAAPTSLALQVRVGPHGSMHRMRCAIHSGSSLVDVLAGLACVLVFACPCGAGVGSGATVYVEHGPWLAPRNEGMNPTECLCQTI
jgi:hypothetical protein